MLLRKLNHNYKSLKLSAVVCLPFVFTFGLGDEVSYPLMMLRAYFGIVVFLLAERWLNEQVYPNYYLSKEQTLSAIQNQVDFTEFNPIYRDDQDIMLTAIALNEDLFKYASKRLKGDQAFLSECNRLIPSILDSETRIPKKSPRTNLQQTQNTCTPSWQGIPQTLYPYILNFLSPIEALPCITTTKGNIQNFGSYIIQRLRHEKLAYQIISSGCSHIIGMRKDGFLISWGYNNRGQLGLGNNPWQVNYQIIDPQYLQGKTIQSIQSGDSHTLALCIDGSLFAWGDNEHGQLGLGHNHMQKNPQLIEPFHFQGKSIQSIHAGSEHTLALCTDESLFAWGRNSSGQLCLDHTNNQNTPQRVNHDHFQGKTIQSIHSKGAHTLVRSTDGSIFSWGDNNDGQLDLGHNNNQLTPNQLPDILEQAFTEGHQRLTQHNVFFNTPDPKHRLLSGCVLQSSELAQSKTEFTTTGLKKSQ